jgi:hypothetical protein
VIKRFMPLLEGALTFIGVHNVCTVLLQAARTGRLTVNSSEVEDVAADLR